VSALPASGSAPPSPPELLVELSPPLEPLEASSPPLDDPLVPELASEPVPLSAFCDDPLDPPQLPVMQATTNAASPTPLK
jgi:hypothetical protein